MKIGFSAFYYLEINSLNVHVHVSFFNQLVFVLLLIEGVRGKKP